MPVQIVPTTEDGDKRFEYAVDDAQAVAKAMQRFNTLVKEGRMAAGRAADGSLTKLEVFDPNVDTLFVPQRAGG